MGELILLSLLLPIAIANECLSRPPITAPLYSHPSFKPVEHTIVTAAMWKAYDKPYLGARYRIKPNRHDRKRDAKLQSI